MAAYLTIQTPAQGRLTEKMSRFLAFAYPAQSADEARVLMAELQRRYRDARHVCWAWVIGAGASPEAFCTDSGEPSGTAGRPILGQINSRGLRNVVVGVVRYFGGIKLGTPGLIAAYREAAALALDDATVVECREMTTLSLRFAYADMNAVMTLAKLPGVEILDRDFNNDCTMTLRLALDDAPALAARLSAIPSVAL